MKGGLFCYFCSQGSDPPPSLPLPLPCQLVNTIAVPFASVTLQFVVVFMCERGCAMILLQCVGGGRGMSVWGE